MTRTKKLVSLFLAMLMVFSLMAVTASAYDSEDGHVHTEACEDEGIQPRGPMYGPPCPYCGCEMTEPDSATGDSNLGVPIRKYRCTSPWCSGGATTN